MEQPVNHLIKQLREKYVAQHPEVTTRNYEQAGPIESPRSYLTDEVIGELHFRTNDSPIRGGRTPDPGENIFLFHWTLEDGTVLYLEMGEASFKRFRGFIFQMEIDDAADQAMESL